MFNGVPNDAVSYTAEFTIPPQLWFARAGLFVMQRTEFENSLEAPPKQQTQAMVQFQGGRGGGGRGFGGRGGGGFGGGRGGGRGGFGRFDEGPPEYVVGS
jgi:uncharacterized membrane protein YgcG